VTFETLRLEREGAVAHLTFDRPRVLNAGNATWVAEFSEAVRQLTLMRELRVAVVTGAGRAFSTGVDLDALAAGEMPFAQFVAWEDAMTALEQLDALVVAGINGHCLGGGLQIALVCDYRLAAAGALVGLPAVKECLVPSMALYRLPRLIGLARAQDLILTGRTITADAAEQYGLVHRVVPDADFPTALTDAVQTLLSLPGTSTRVSKRLVRKALDLDFAAFRREMETGFQTCLASEEHRTAMEAIRARRATR
jgi:enoyl-CoA hydratase/carnithine racemase